MSRFYFALQIGGPTERHDKGYKRTVEKARHTTYATMLLRQVADIVGAASHEACPTEHLLIFHVQAGPYAPEGKVQPLLHSANKLPKAGAREL